MPICNPHCSLQGGEFLVQGSLISLGAPQAGWQMPLFQAPFYLFPHPGIRGQGKASMAS